MLLAHISLSFLACLSLLHFLSTHALYPLSDSVSAVEEPLLGVSILLGLSVVWAFPSQLQLRPLHGIFRPQMNSV